MDTQESCKQYEVIKKEITLAVIVVIAGNSMIHGEYLCCAFGSIPGVTSFP